MSLADGASVVKGCFVLLWPFPCCFRNEAHLFIDACGGLGNQLFGLSERQYVHAELLLINQKFYYL